MNTAGRLLHLLQKIRRDPNDHTRMMEVWISVFELTPGEVDVEDEAVRGIQAIRSELDLLRRRLLDLGVADELINPGWSRFRSVATTATLQAAWASAHYEIHQPECELVFRWADWALRDECEDDMPAEELAALHSELASLERALTETDMTSYLRHFVQRQIDSIRAALRLYPVRGVKPIKEALQQVAGAYMKRPGFCGGSTL